MSNEKHNTTHEADSSCVSRENQTQYVTPADTEQAFLAGGYYASEEGTSSR